MDIIYTWNDPLKDRIISFIGKTLNTLPGDTYDKEVNHAIAWENLVASVFKKGLDPVASQAIIECILEPNLKSIKEISGTHKFAYESGNNSSFIITITPKVFPEQPAPKVTKANKYEVEAD